ncbi:MAG: pectate lyase [Prevotella sp.]|nr:pectate lyase [Prevotella sp.]
MKMNKKLLTGLLTMIMCALFAQTATAEDAPAFPGAEGFGRYVTGGRGGKVYHVTTLEDNNSVGSFRYAINQTGKRIIVFDVSGTIQLKSTLQLKKPNVTIAGQTAPGDGICIAGYPFQISTNNVIIRYMRFRVGSSNVTVSGADGWDGLGSLDQKNIIVDHCSVSWSIDECCSFSGCSDITLQWTLVSQSLVNAGHNKGAHGYGGNWGGSGASYHHNLLAHHGSRTPRLGPRPTTQTDERMDMRNNVIYNFGGNGCYGGEGMSVNIVNNYYKPGPGSPTDDKGKRIAGIGIRTKEYCTTYPAYAPMMHVWGKYFVEGNVNSQYGDVTEDNWTYGMYNQIDAGGNDGTYTAVTKDTIKLDAPIENIPVTMHTAQNAYDKVLKYVGASIKRDALDEIMISDTRDGKASFTGTGNGSGFINTENDVKYADGTTGLPTLTGTAAPTDTDQDGMPDAWETANGLNPNSSSDAALYSLDSKGYYTNIEVYINSLVEEMVKSQNADAITSIDEYYPMYKDENGVVYNDPNRKTYTYILADANSTYSNKTYTYSDDMETNGDESILSMSFVKSGMVFASPANGYDRLYKGSKHTITLPEGLNITSINISGYANSSSTNAYISEMCGTTYGTTDFVLPKYNADGSFAATDNKFRFAEAKTGSMTFTLGGADAFCIITLEGYLTGALGIEESVSVPVRIHDGKTYNLQGIEVSEPTQKGIYIRNGKKIIIK